MGKNRIPRNCGSSEPQEEKPSLELGKNRGEWQTVKSCPGRPTRTAMAVKDEQRDLA